MKPVLKHSTKFYDQNCRSMWLDQVLFVIRYSRADKVKFVEHGLWKIRSGMVWLKQTISIQILLGLNFFYVPQIFNGPVLNVLPLGENNTIFVSSHFLYSKYCPVKCLDTWVQWEESSANCALDFAIKLLISLANIRVLLIVSAAENFNFMPVQNLRTIWQNGPEREHLCSLHLSSPSIFYNGKAKR